MLRRRDQAICPCCGQRLLVRHGVKLPPLLADLFDMIERCDGVSADVLAGVFYPGQPAQVGRNRIKSNISHLNALLAGTDLQIRAGRYEPYRLIRAG